MKMNLKEEISRILELSDYGRKKLFEQDEKKAELASKDVTEFFETLESAVKEGGLSEEEKGSMVFKKAVESLQIGLILLGYELPRFGVDGLFGPETSDAIKKFEVDNLNKDISKEKGLKKVDSETIEKLIDMLKSKNIKSEDLKKHINSGFDITNVSDKNYYERLLDNLGAPKSDENIKFLLAWRQSEGKAGKFNPFNTTHKMPGSTRFNKAGVQNYLTLEDGFIATLKTLKNGRYSCIIDGLKNDIGANEIAKCDSLKTWGTGDLVAKVLRGYDSGSSPKVSSIA